MYCELRISSKFPVFCVQCKTIHEDLFMIVAPYDVINVSCPHPLAFHSWWRCLMKSQMVFVLNVLLLSPRFQDFTFEFPIYLLTGVLFLFTSAFCNSFAFYKQKILWTRSLDPFSLRQAHSNSPHRSRCV